MSADSICNKSSGFTIGRSWFATLLFSATVLICLSNPASAQISSKKEVSGQVKADIAPEPTKEQAEAEKVTSGRGEPEDAKAIKNWVCDAVIHLTGTSVTWTPATWSMSGNILTDREKACRNYIIANWFDNGAIWNYIKPQLTAAQQDAICKAGSGTFRIDYGFDRRTKDWSITRTIPAPPCNCTAACPDGYHLSGNGNCAKGMCATGSLPNQSYFQNGEGMFIWNGNLYHQVSATNRTCAFK